MAGLHIKNRQYILPKTKNILLAALSGYRQMAVVHIPPSTSQACYVKEQQLLTYF
jgi:hypothetical protein